MPVRYSLAINNEVRVAFVFPSVLWFLTSAILAAGIVILLAWKRRQERAVDDFSRQIEQLTREEGAAGRIGLEGKPHALGQLSGAVNQLLETLEERGAQLQRSRAIVPAAGRDGARRRARAPQEHPVRQRAFPFDARDERRRGDRQAPGRLRRPGICGAGGEQSRQAARGRARRRALRGRAPGCARRSHAGRIVEHADRQRGRAGASA